MTGQQELTLRAFELDQPFVARRVFVAGPLVGGEPTQWTNVRLACEVGTLLMQHGFVPFVPHTSVLWDLTAPVSDETRWRAWALEWLAQCQALVLVRPDLAIAGGVRTEVDLAFHRRIPCFSTVHDLLLATGRRR